MPRLPANALADRSRYRFKPGDRTVEEALNDPATAARWANIITTAKTVAKARQTGRAPAASKLQSRGRSPRVRSNHRRHGSRRGAVTRAGPDDSSDPEPPGVDPRARR